MGENNRPCGTCRHLDTRILPSGAAYCWARYVWVMPDKIVSDCTQAERANGNPPPGQIHFEGERR